MSKRRHLKSYLVGKAVRITFLDHVQSDDGPEPPLTFTVHGLVVSDQKHWISVASWYLPMAVDAVAHGAGNEVIFTIVKSTITDIKVAKWN